MARRRVPARVQPATVWVRNTQRRQFHTRSSSGCQTLHLCSSVPIGPRVCWCVRACVGGPVGDVVAATIALGLCLSPVEWHVTRESGTCLPPLPVYHPALPCLVRASSRAQELGETLSGPTLALASALRQSRPFTYRSCLIQPLSFALHAPPGVPQTHSKPENKKNGQGGRGGPGQGAHRRHGGGQRVLRRPRPRGAQELPGGPIAEPIGALRGAGGDAPLVCSGVSEGTVGRAPHTRRRATEAGGVPRVSAEQVGAVVARRVERHTPRSEASRAWWWRF